MYVCKTTMAETNHLRGNLGSNHPGHEFVGEAVFELDGAVRSPFLSTDAPGEEDPDEALLVLQHLHALETAHEL